MFERGLKNSFIENEVTFKILQQTGDEEKLYLLHKSLKPLFYSKIHRSFFGVFFWCHVTKLHSQWKYRKKMKKKKSQKQKKVIFFPSMSLFIQWTVLLTQHEVMQFVFSHTNKDHNFFCTTKWYHLLKSEKNIFNFKERNYRGIIQK